MGVPGLTLVGGAVGGASLGGINGCNGSWVANGAVKGGGGATKPDD